MSAARPPETIAGEVEAGGRREVILGIRPEDVRVARSGDASCVRLRLDLVVPQSLPEAGAEIALALDEARLHFFDPVTRETLRAAAAPAS